VNRVIAVVAGRPVVATSAAMRGDWTIVIASVRTELGWQGVWPAALHA